MPTHHRRFRLAIGFVLTLSAAAGHAPPAVADDPPQAATAAEVSDAAAAASSSDAAAVAAGSSDAAAVAAARDAVYPALVNIAVVSESFGDGREMRFPSAGSGVIVSAEGYVLTNFHVAGHSVRLTCTLTDGRVRQAKVIADDPLSDLSVLELLPSAGAPSGPYPHATLGDSDRLAVGDPVIAMGNPLALASSVTLGIVSNPERVFTDFAGSDLADLELGAGEPTGIFTRWIQHDALILPGNSGGPLVNLRGEVVGINELGGGFGFAIPSNMAAEVLRQAVAGGEIRRGWLGFSVLPVTKLGLAAGALVSGVLPGSPAERAGLTPGDVLVALDGEPVTVRFLEQVPLIYQRIAGLPIGGAARLKVSRSGADLELTAQVEAMKPFRGEEGEVSALGITALEVTEPFAVLRRFPSAAGLVVTGLRPGYPAEDAKPPLAADDVILTVDGRAVDSLADLRAAVDGGDQRLLGFRRGRADLVTVVRPHKQEARRWGGDLPLPWLALDAQVLTPEIATALGAPGTTGFRVTEVFPGTAAARSGLAAGDLLVALEGDPLTASRPQDREDLRRTVETRSIGDRVTLGVLRDGQRRDVEVELEARPEEPSQADRTREEELGFAVRDLAFRERVERQGGKSRAGMLVVEVTSGGWAQVAGLELGDLLLAVNGKPVVDTATFSAVMTGVVAARPPVVQLFVERGPRTHFVFVEPDWSETGDGNSRRER